MIRRIDCPDLLEGYQQRFGITYAFANFIRFIQVTVNDRFDASAAAVDRECERTAESARPDDGDTLSFRYTIPTKRDSLKSANAATDSPAFTRSH